MSCVSNVEMTGCGYVLMWSRQVTCLEYSLGGDYMMTVIEIMSFDCDEYHVTVTKSVMLSTTD